MLERVADLDLVGRAGGGLTSPDQHAPIAEPTLGEWLLWLWLVRLLCFIVALNAELRVEAGPPSAALAFLHVLSAAKLDGVVAPGAIAAAGGKLYERFGPQRP